MNFKLVDSRWNEVIADAVKKVRTGARLRIICPFIKEVAAKRFLRGSYKSIQVITRFDLNGFRARVCDASALRALLNAGAQIKGIRNLHAKVYLVGKRVIVTSANITEQGLGATTNSGSGRMIRRSLQAAIRISMDYGLAPEAPWTSPGWPIGRYKSRLRLLPPSALPLLPG